MAGRMIAEALAVASTLMCSLSCMSSDVNHFAIYNATQTDAGTTIHPRTGDELKLSLAVRGDQDWRPITNDDAIVTLISSVLLTDMTGKRVRIATFRFERSGSASIVACPVGQTLCTAQSFGALVYYIKVE